MWHCRAGRGRSTAQKRNRARERARGERGLAHHARERAQNTSVRMAASNVVAWFSLQPSVLDVRRHTSEESHISLSAPTDYVLLVQSIHELELLGRAPLQVISPNIFCRCRPHEYLEALFSPASPGCVLLRICFAHLHHVCLPLVISVKLREAFQILAQHCCLVSGPFPSPYAALHSQYPTRT